MFLDLWPALVSRGADPLALAQSKKALLATSQISNPRSLDPLYTQSPGSPLASAVPPCDVVAVQGPESTSKLTSLAAAYRLTLIMASRSKRDPSLARSVSSCRPLGGKFAHSSPYVRFRLPPPNPTLSSRVNPSRPRRSASPFPWLPPKPSSSHPKSVLAVVVVSVAMS